jgi:hypothetical protein
MTEPTPDPAKMCGRCYDEVPDLYPANCAEKPERYGPDCSLGMYHCPDCGAMVLAGMEHPPLCAPCLARQHPRFDAANPA